MALVAGTEDKGWSIYTANKSDGTRTIFYAYKNKNSAPYAWRVMCPSKKHMEGFGNLLRAYWNNEVFNQENRAR